MPARRSRPREEQLRILRQAQRGRGIRDLPADQVRGAEALLTRGRRSRSSRLLDEVMPAAAEAGLDEVAIGMPHRGRLNVLANIAGKSYGQIFREFEGNLDLEDRSGLRRCEVPPRHRGHVHRARRQRRSTSISPPTPPTSRRSIRCSRGSCAPSRISSGSASGLHRPARADARRCRVRRPGRRRRDARTCRNCRATAPVAPCTSSSTTRSASPRTRSTAAPAVYATDVARMIQAPIFHVNGDDPEAVVRVAQDWPSSSGSAFNKDVVIDLVCYRRRGHNEADDPSLTQPLMYNLIDAKRSVRKLYTEALIGRGDITVEEAERRVRHFQEQLEQVFRETREAADEDRRDGRARLARSSSVARSRWHRRLPSATWSPLSRASRRPRGSAQLTAARRLHRPSSLGAAAAAPRPDGRGRHDRLGHGRGAGLRISAQRRPRCAWPARTPGAARSASGTW